MRRNNTFHMDVDQRRVVFLDIDGVLNNEDTVELTPYGLTGIDDDKVACLASAINEYGNMEIVLISDWKEMNPKDDDYVYLVSKFQKFGLSIADHTDSNVVDRGAGIMSYLKVHPEVEEYVILDDKNFYFKDYGELWDRLLLTAGIENVRFASETPAKEAVTFMKYIVDAFISGK